MVYRGAIAGVSSDGTSERRPLGTERRQTGIRVEYSNRIERLVESLAAVLEGGRSIESLFEPPRVVVPNRNVEKYLKFELADRFGVVGDIAFSTLEAWLRDSLPEAVTAVDETRLVSGILGLLTSAEVYDGVEAMEPVRAYLEADGEGGRDLRAYQLARRLASNFREYAYSRVRMIEKWREGDELYTEAPQYRRTERWQRWIWRALLGDGGLLERTAPSEPTYRLLTEYWRSFDPARREDLPESLHLFGLSHVSPVYGQIFDRLAETVELRFFILNPCREYWEDVVYDRDEEVLEPTERDSGANAPGLIPVSEREEGEPGAVEGPQLDLSLEESDAPVPLAVWGRAGRDHVHMLNRLSGDMFGEDWVDPAADSAGSDGPTLLEAFQSDVLRYVRAEKSGFGPEPDDSVAFIEAPGVRRELEAVADAIWRTVEAHDDIDFNDIAVVVNPRRREEYQMHLEAVFEEVRGIPFNQVDVERGDGSRLLQAAELLFELPLGEFDRRELGSLLVHPNVVANHDAADPEEWARWCEELAIYHGADAEDHAGTHIDRDLYNWDQGVKRLVLGAFLEERPRGAKRTQPIELGGETYLPETPVELAEPETAARWIELVRRLIGEAELTRERDDSLGGWLRWMANWLEEHLAPAAEGEEAELAGYLEALRTAADADLSEEIGGGTVPYRAAVEFARTELASRTYQRGHYLATGVVVSSFLPQRPIPFEAIFMTGMSAEDFPASSPRTPIDLRTAQWHEGDLWDRDRERYMFFETLLSARRRVTCSWVAREPITGEEVEPSSVVREFQHVLEQYVGESGLGELVRDHPLRRFDETYFDGDTERELGPTFHPAARAERRARRMRETMVGELGGPPTRELDARRVAATADDTTLAETFGLVDVPEPPSSPEERPRARALPFRAFQKFLESPLQGWARYRLGLRADDEEATLAETDEPFELDALGRSTILREAFETSLHGADDIDAPALAAAVHGEFERALLAGRAPAGMFSRVAEDRLEAVAERWSEQIETSRPAALRRFRFGAPAGDDDVEAVAALRLEVERDGESQTLELVGDTGLVDAEGAAVVVATQRDFGSLSWRHALRGWVQGLVLSAAEIFESEAFEVTLLTTDGRGPRRLEFGDNAPRAALAQLESLARQLWFDAHEYRFAISEIEEVVDETGAVDPESLREAIWNADDSEYGNSRDVWGPVANVQRFDIPSDDPATLLEMLERRMGPFLDTMLEA